LNKNVWSLADVSLKRKKRNEVASLVKLHDDFVQRVALAAIELQIILDAVGNSQSNVRERLRKLLKTVNELGKMFTRFLTTCTRRS
jgi:hypothetical protein